MTIGRESGKNSGRNTANGYRAREIDIPYQRRLSAKMMNDSEEYPEI